MVADWEELSLHDGVQSHGIDGNARTLRNDNEESALKLEVDEEGNVVGALLTLSELCEYEKSSPTLTALGDAHTLHDGGKWFEVAFCHAARLDNPQGTKPAVEQKHVGDNDGDGEDPFGNLEWDLGLDLARPIVEGEQVHCGEGVGGIDGARDEDEDPEPGIGQWGKT